MFRFRNLASPIKGRPKVFLVAPSLRQALLNMDESRVREPDEWGRLVENAATATIMATSGSEYKVGFWAKRQKECDVVRIPPTGPAEFLEVKRSGKKAVRGIRAAAEDLDRGGQAYVLARRDDPAVLWTGHTHPGAIVRLPVAGWLYSQVAADGGTLRLGGR